MRVVTNDKLIKRNRQIATRLFFFSLFVLFAGFFVANGQLFGVDTLEQVDPTIYVLIMPLVLAIGFTATLVSVRMTNLWLRLPRPEDAIREGLKGISNKSALYNYHHLPARHVLVSPQGVFAITTRFQDGKFSVKRDRWRTHRSFVSQLFAVFRFDGVGNPTRDAQDAANYVRYLVEDYDPDLMIQPLIVFVDPRAELEIDDPTIPVLHADLKKEPNLKTYFKNLPKSPSLGDANKLTAFIEEFEASTLDD